MPELHDEELARLESNLPNGLGFELGLGFTGVPTERLRVWRSPAARCRHASHERPMNGPGWGEACSDVADAVAGDVAD